MCEGVLSLFRIDKHIVMKRLEVAANLVEAFKMQCDDWRQAGDQHLLSGTSVNFLHLLIYSKCREKMFLVIYGHSEIRTIWSYEETTSTSEQ